ncbi:hypothetical protein NM962_01315 [Mycobacterium sp. SVM_VP21]|nr:hypothetical protein NM962_01315 [Mycobacterium sp. SVM_VP21]
MTDPLPDVGLWTAPMRKFAETLSDRDGIGARIYEILNRHHPTRPFSNVGITREIVTAIEQEQQQ